MPWQCLNFLPEPQGHGALRDTVLPGGGVGGVHGRVGRAGQGGGAFGLQHVAAGILGLPGGVGVRCKAPNCGSNTGGGGSWPISTRASMAVTRSFSSSSMALNRAKASLLYSFSGSRWP